MKILIVGGGGREHALAWKLAGDTKRRDVFCAPGNAGTAAVAVNLSIKAEDVPSITEWARENRPDLTVIGPEAPLCAGLADSLIAEGFRVFGPTADAARIEGSKVFAKELMRSAGVPTAGFEVFEESSAAIEYVRSRPLPLVIKADGLAAGKGVWVCSDLTEAEKAIETIMVTKAYGSAGDRVVIEECLEGEEASILALVDGETAVPLASSQDHKRAFDNDKGPNTGGMGAYSPAPVVTQDMWPVIADSVINPMLAEFRRRGIVYKGVLYAGLMIGEDGLKVLEFNCRFGDPETQAVIPRIKGDFLPALEACIDGTLRPESVEWKPHPCVCVVMASRGYPGPYDKGRRIEGLKEAESLEGVVVFHAGTKLRDGHPVTSGGRVLGVTATATAMEAAVRQAYLAVSRIRFEGAQYRKDIGARALGRQRT